MAVVGAAMALLVASSCATPHVRGAGESQGEEHEQFRPVLASSTGQCGVERWSVKVATDSDASKINQTPQATTIETMTALPKPSSLPESSRISPTELQVFTITAMMTVYKLEDDSDYHLVIQDGAGRTMIVEIPDPACAAGSVLLSGIQNARSQFDARYSATSSFKTASIPVKVTGVGFFDYLHGQTGVAPNGVELHPILDVQFNPASNAGSVVRIAGSDRYETAAAVSPATFSSGVSVAYLATGATYPDALAAGPAATKNAGPVLLTTRDSLPASTKAELQRLAPKSIVVLGGTGAVSDAVAAEARSYTDGEVRRIAGPDRYATSTALSATTFGAPAPVAYVANGEGFPDALSGGPAAGVSGGPILLVTPGSIPTATADELTRLKPSKIVILGGTAAVSSAVEQQLAGFTTGSVTRDQGADRYATSAAVSASTFSASVSKAFLATGENFPDALAAGPSAGIAAGPVLLVHRDCIPVSVNSEIDRLSPGQLVILGGTSSVSTAVESRTTCPAAPPPTTTTTAPASKCDAAYPDFCIPPPPPDLNCKDLNPQDYPGAHANFTALPPDPHGFDGDGDGLGCESGIG